MTECIFTYHGKKEEECFQHYIACTPPSKGMSVGFDMHLANGIDHKFTTFRVKSVEVDIRYYVSDHCQPEPTNIVVHYWVGLRKDHWYYIWRRITFTMMKPIWVIQRWWESRWE